MTKKQPEIAVTRYEKDGLFIYECERLPGLYVADSDDRIAYNRLPGVIRTIIRLEQGVDCEVAHAEPYENFSRAIRLTQRAIAGVRGHTDELMRSPQDKLAIIIQTQEGASPIQ